MAKLRTKPTINLTGKVLGRLTVLKFDEYKIVNGLRWPYWFVKCECGKKRSLRQNVLVGLKTQKSCGCLLNDFRKNILPGIASKRNAIEPGKAMFNDIFYSYKYRAKLLNVSFTLTKKQFKVIINRNCFYCGVEPLQIRRKRYVNGLYLFI